MAEFFPSLGERNQRRTARTGCSDQVHWRNIRGQNNYQIDVVLSTPQYWCLLEVPMVAMTYNLTRPH
jgi:hypothetical protein